MYPVKIFRIHNKRLFYLFAINSINLLQFSQAKLLLSMKIYRVQCKLLFYENFNIILWNIYTIANKSYSWNNVEAHIDTM